MAKTLFKTFVGRLEKYLIAYTNRRQWLVANERIPLDKTARICPSLKNHKTKQKRVQ